MLTYNTQLPSIPLPEYGRNIQRMVDLCMTIENRDERNRCAHSIIKAMGNLFPAIRDSEDGVHKLWDHLFIMSGFELDVDFPYEVIRPENLASEPAKIPYNNPLNDSRHYGRYIIYMIDRIASMEPGVERDTLTMLVANQMKKIMVEENDGNVEDGRIFNDMAIISRGAIRLSPEFCVLNDYKLFMTEGKKKKKK
ncbi:MAG: DUF4290 domain-containing protein [Muribaculaceae bacterium]|nr:DUF4290 domain-containing protein [Muribaculaceae bacterium]